MHLSNHTVTLRFQVWKLTNKLLVLIALCGSGWLTVNAQYTIIGQNSFGGTNVYGPMTTNPSADSFYSRHAYIYPSSTLGALKNGDSIRSLEFFKSDLNQFAGKAEFRIYMAMSSQADFGAANIHWPNEVTKSGTQLVYNGNPANVVDASTGFKRFDFSKIFVFDTTKGSHLKILVEFRQFTRQTNAVTWVYENDFSVPAFISNNETKYVSGFGKPTDSTVGSNLRKPFIKINYPRYRENLEVSKIYCLGRVPVLMNRADTIMALVGNSGLETVYGHKLYLKVTGANSFLDSIYIDSISPYQEKIYSFGTHLPDTQGTETLTVYVDSDGFADDDKDSVSRIVGYNVYSHADPFQGNAGGIGFNGSTGDFVAKFYTDSAIYINQIKVDFAISGRDFQLGIWEENSRGLPGKNIFTSDSLISVAGTYILAVLPRVKVDGGYFVGIRQTGTTNVAFAYQPETPVRPNAFYFTAPLGDTTWTPFAPGFDFKFNIQPRIQVGNDVAVLRIENPINGDTIEYNQFDSIAPRASIVNFGFIDQNAPFDVVCEVTNQFGQQVYRDVQTIKIKSNDSVTVTFKQSLSTNNYGTLRMRVYTKLHSDKVLDNDTLQSTFNIVIRHDVAVESYFDPAEGQKFELNTDKVGPVIRLVNNGASSKSNIRVTSRIRQGTKISNVQTKSASLSGTESLIVPFDSFTIPWWGDVVFEAFSWNVVDSFPINDTARVNVYVDKSHDIGVLSISKPKDQSRFVRKTEFQPYVNLRNYGVKDQDTVPVIAIIKNALGNELYRDSQIVKISKFSTAQVLFKRFTCPDSAQTLYFTVISDLIIDQDTTNDVASSIFKVVTARDIAAKEIIDPKDLSVINSNTLIVPKLKILNLGNDVISTPPVFYFEIKDQTGGVVYLDSSTFGPGLSIEDVDTIYFGKSYNAKTKGKYTCRAWHKWSQDGESSNNQITSSFEVTYTKSVLASSIVIPEADKFYAYNSAEIFPKVILRNDGLETTYEQTNYKLEITNASQNVVYNETGSLDSIQASKTVTIDFPVSFKMNKTGTFSAVLTISNPDDQYKGDDTLSSVFRVVKNYDVEVTEMLVPGNDTALFVNRTYAPVARFTNVGDSALRTNFSVSYMIYKGTTLLYNINESITLNNGEVIDVSFDSSFIAPDRGNYRALAIARLGADQEKTNDTLEISFDVDFPSSTFKPEVKNITLYPNPTTGTIHLEFPQSSEPSIFVYNNIGQELHTGWRILNNQSGIGNLQLNVSDLKPAVYFVKFVWKDGSANYLPFIRN